MIRFFKRRGGPAGLEAELREGRPQPRPEFLAALAEQVTESAARSARRPVRRLALAGALSAALLVGAASVGGFGYAATAAKKAFDDVKSVLVTSPGPGDAIEVGGLSAGGDQYQPGYSWGDPDHTHDGPPGLVRRGGELAPPLVASCQAATARVALRFVLDEQADLAVTVTAPGGKKLLLTPAGDRPKAKTLRYRVLVPRAMRIVFSVPCSLIQDGRNYRIRIRATDPAGESAWLVVPFWAQVPSA